MYDEFGAVRVLSYGGEGGKPEPAKPKPAPEPAPKPADIPGGEPAPKTDGGA